MSSRSEELLKLCMHLFLSLLVFGLAIWHHSHWFDVGFNIFDTGFQVYGADRVARGAVLYRDVFTLYGPGIYYLTALGFHLWRPTVLVWKIIICLCFAVAAVVTYHLSNRLMSTPFALLLSLATIFFFLPDWGVTLAILTLMILFVALERGGRPWFFLCGVANGLTGLFRQEVAFYTLAACAVLIALHTARLGGIAGWKDAAIRLGKTLLLFGLGVAFLLGPTLVYFGIHSALDDMFYFLLPKANYQIHTGALRFPSLFPLLPETNSAEGWREVFSRLQFYLPIFIYLATASLLLCRAGRKRVTDRVNDKLLAILIFGVLLFNSALVRSDRPHLIFSILPARILAWYLLYLATVKIWRGLAKVRGDPRRITQITGAFLLLLLPLAHEWEPLSKPYDALMGDLSTSHVKATMTRLNLPRAELYMPAEEAQFLTEVTEDVVSRTTPDEKIFVFPSLAPAIYFLSERDNATRYDWIISGVLDPAEQREVVATLEKAKVRYVVLYSSRSLEATREIAVDTGAELIFDYIIENYAVEEVAPRYQILRRHQ